MKPTRASAYALIDGGSAVHKANTDYYSQRPANLATSVAVVSCQAQK